MISQKNQSDQQADQCNGLYVRKLTPTAMQW